MQTLTHAPSADAAGAPVRRVAIAVLVVLALGLWLAVTAGPAVPADAEPLAGHSWVG